MKYTLLEIVQNILSSMNGDEVNSIGDTVESEQVANEVRNAYFNNIDNLNVPTFSGLVQLEDVLDTSRPNYLKIPDNVKDIEWFKYSATVITEPAYKDISLMQPKDFLNRILTRDPTADEIDIIEDFNGPRLLIKNDAPPNYWTTFDNTYIVTDNYDSTLESTLHANKSMAYGQYIQSWSHVDSFIPPLDDSNFTMLLAEAKSSCFLNIKQVTNVKEEKRARNGLIRNQNDRWRANQRNFRSIPDFGRRRP